jgi:hypothetical protein
VDGSEMLMLAMATSSGLRELWIKGKNGGGVWNGSSSGRRRGYGWRA